MELKYSLAHKAAADDSARSIICYGSRFDQVDRDGELIIREAFEHPDSLAEYLKHPVILVGHDSRGMICGRAEKVEVTPAGLKLKISFLDTQAGREAFEVCRSGSGDLGTFSIGFQGLESEYREAADLRKRGVDVALATGPRVRTWTHLKLLEVSLVALPANIGATVVGKAFKDGRIKSAEMRKELDTVIYITAADPTPKDLDPYGYFVPARELRGLAADVADLRKKAEARIQRDADRIQRLAAENARLKQLQDPKTPMTAEEVRAFLKSPEFNEQVKLAIAKAIGKVY